MSLIKKIPSPNYDLRDDPTDISLIVVHNISLPPDEYGSDDIIDFFLNKLDHAKHEFYQEIKGVEVSSHYLIRRCGEIIEFVPPEKRAWHAGVSEYKGRNNCNDFSIGIELEGSDNEEFEQIQYAKLAQLIALLRAKIPKLNKDKNLANIVGHSDIAPGRKTDPGPYFDWEILKKLLK